MAVRGSGLGTANDVEISLATGIPPAAVAWYVKLFFDIRDRLTARDYIIIQVLGTRFVRRELTLNDKDVLLKFFRFFGGPLVIDAAAPYVLDPTLNLTAVSPEQGKLGDDMRRLISVLTTRIVMAPEEHQQYLSSDDRELLREEDGKRPDGADDR